MRHRSRDVSLFGVVAAFLASLAATTPFNPALTGSDLTPRAPGNAPGLGVELEVSRISLDTSGKDWTPELRENIKGAEMLPNEFIGKPKTNWMLTAEVGATGSLVFTEVIVDGTKNMVGKKATKAIGQEIFTYFKEWAPCRARGCKVNIKGFENLNPWTIHWPNPSPLDPAAIAFSPQVTTAMPLESLLEILKDTKDKKDNPLASKVTRNSEKITILKKDDFKPFGKIKSEDITDDFLGYFSLLTSYCVLAKANDPREGPKRSLSIMPRTDFVAQYIQFVEQKLEAQFCDGKTSLYDIVQQVSGRDGSLAGEKFSWTPGSRREIDEKWNGMEDDLRTGTLQVEKFLNYIQGYDKKPDREPHDRMETVLGSDKPAPIFEFRELTQAIGDGLANTMESYENKVIEYHSRVPKKRSILVRQESNAECKSKSKRPKCPPGQLVAMIKNAPLCQDKCPEGQKKNQKGDECEADCPADQALKATGDGCEVCKKGEKPNAKRDKCEKDNDDQNKCADGEAKSGPDGKCEACPKDKKPTTGGDKCEPKTEDDKKKDKEVDDKKKRMKRAGFCLGFVGVALGGIEGVDLASDEGAALINAEAAVVADEWPKDVEFKEADLGNSNIEPEVPRATVMIGKRFAGPDPFTPTFKLDSSKAPIRPGRPSRRSDNSLDLLPSSTFTPAFLVSLKPGMSTLHKRFFWLIPAIIRGVTGAGRGAVRAGGSVASKLANDAIKTGKAFKNTKQDTGSPAKISNQVGKNTKVPNKPAKFGEKMKAIKDNKSFKDCLALAAVSYVGDMAFHTGTNVPPGGFTPEERALVLTVFTDEDNKGGDESTVQTYNDDFYHPDRLEPGRCSNFEDPFENSITGYDVALGCCRFYKDPGCKNAIFAATNREHADLQDDANDSISSFACTFDSNCKDIPA